MAKKIIFIIPQKDFRDEEYFISKEVLESNGIKVVTASNERKIALGADGGEVPVDIEIKDIKIEDYEGLIFIGGPGSLTYLNNQQSHNLAIEAFKQGKIVGAICISPIILSEAGLLNGKKATVWSDSLNKEPIRLLQESGAEYLKEDIVVDGKIITANGPDSAKEFGQAIYELTFS